MNDNQNWRNIGEQMKSALTDALQTGDFKQLNNLVSQTVANTLNEVGIHIMPDNNDQHNNQNDSKNFSDKNQGGQATSNQKQSQQKYGQSSDSHEPAFHRWGQTPENKEKNTPNWKKSPDSQGQAYYNRQQNTDKQGQAFYNRQHATDKQWQASYNRRQSPNTQRQTFYNGQQSYNTQRQAFHNRQQPPNTQGQAFYNNQNAIARQRQMPSTYNTETSLAKIKRIGNVSGTLYQIFGGIGFGVTLLIALIQMSVYLASGAFSTTGCIVTFIFLSFFFGMIRIGISQKRRLRRARRYVQLCGNKMFEDIQKLAGSTGKDERYVVKDIQKMLEIGMFPEGHLDSQKTCFMLNDKVYRQYIETEKHHEQIEKEKLSNKSETSQTDGNQTTTDTLTEQETELNTMVSEGMNYIRKLRDLNDKISGEVISSKLFRLENLLKNIFERVKEHPEQMNRMHKLMSYYLPTTLKLIETYEEFDQISSPGKDITDAKAEIENTLDTINQAFAELLNNLFQDAVFDATTDAQVLKTMLAREGLMNEIEFVTNRTEN